MNRTIYDSCAYQQTLGQSIAPLSYVMDPIKYEHGSKCRMELGIVGGTAVSHVSGNLVDLENDLRGANRPATQCPAYKYLPGDGKTLQGKDYIKQVDYPVVDLAMNHLPSCQMVEYGSVPLAPEQPPYKCNGDLMTKQL